MTGASSYFDVYRDERPSAAPKQYAPRSRKHTRMPPPAIIVPASVPPETRVNQELYAAAAPGPPELSARRSASARQSKQTSSVASPTLSMDSSTLPEPDSPFKDININNCASSSSDVMDALYDTLATTPSRQGRASERHRGKGSDSQRRREQQQLDRHGRELKAKLQSLATARQPNDHDSRTRFSMLKPTQFQHSIVHTSESESETSSECLPPQRSPPALFLQPRESLSKRRTQSQHATTEPKHAPSRSSSLPFPSAASTPSFTRSAASNPTKRIPSIRELVQAHEARLQAPSDSTSRTSSHISAPPFEPSSTKEDSETSSIDSIMAEAVHLGVRPNHKLKNSKSMPDVTNQLVSAKVAQGSSVTMSADRMPAIQDSELSELSAFLKSPRLTKVLRLPGYSSALNVSIADVGDAQGHPVVVCLGLGSVRYLVALYDELAEAMHLRLICIDRWGLGKSTDVPEDQRGFLEWAKVVDAVADELELKRFSLLAHSAGAPYALATSLRCSERVSGTLHLLAPWVNNSVKGHSSQHKLLKFVPSTIITTAQAAEWKVQAWKLGRRASLATEAPNASSRAPISSAQYHGTTGVEMLDDGFPSPPSISSHESTPRGNGRRKVSLTDVFATRKSFSPEPIRRPSTAGPAFRAASIGFSTSRDVDVCSASLSPRSSSVASPTSTTSASHRTSTATARPAHQHSATELAKALLQASYSESLSGGTKDLLAILERTNKPYGFAYEDIRHRVKVWHGEQDERVSLASVQAFQAVVPDCELQVIPRADHSLMTNTAVMYEVLDSIRLEHL